MRKGREGRERRERTGLRGVHVRGANRQARGRNEERGREETGQGSGMKREVEEEDGGKEIRRDEGWS